MPPLAALDPGRGSPHRRIAATKAPTPDGLDWRLAALAARQHGVVSLPQILAAGAGHGAVQRRVRAGRLHRLFPGVFAVGHPAVSPLGRHLAATLACGDDAVLSHRAAAHLHGVWTSRFAPPEVTIPGTRRRGPAGIRAHRGRLDPADVTTVDGIRVTTVARLLLDLAEGLAVAHLVAVVDRCQARRLYDPDAVRAVIGRGAGRRGLRTLTRALMIVRPQDVLTRSELERRALRLLADAGIATPEVNEKLGRYEVDLLWRDRGLVVELDGREWHDTADAFERDRRRDADLMASGWRVMRLTWRQVVNEPRWVAGRLRAALAHRTVSR